MNQPTPAIVAQNAVRRLPRLALLLFCLAYVLPGFIGRGPWKNADMTAFGYMQALAGGTTDWLKPTLLGRAPEFDALLPYWLGAWAMRAAPAWIAPDLAARLPFMLLLVLSLVATWYAVYCLARHPNAQPVAFAFGGEARPADYARAIADGALLALIATLGLAQLSHETTPALAQLGFTALTFFTLAARPWRPLLAWPLLPLALAGLALSGAPSTAVLLAGGGAVLWLIDTSGDGQSHDRDRRWTIYIAACAVAVAVLATLLDLWRWRVGLPMGAGRDWRSIGRLVLWFTWPAWPLALLTLWRWRRQLVSLHLALPLWFALVAVVATLVTPSSDRSLLLGLPALAALAAFALPTLRRSVAALIDWFTLIFFSGCALIIWVVWISMQTGMPAKPAANVAKLAPGFEPGFSVLAFAVALAATLCWAGLVHWRAGRHRAAIWKSLVLPAGGAALCWLLLMTLWLPLLDFARSYRPVVAQVQAQVGAARCVEIDDLSRAQVAALRFHGDMKLVNVDEGADCPWQLRGTAPQEQDHDGAVHAQPGAGPWRLFATVRRPTDANDTLLLYQRSAR